MKLNPFTTIISLYSNKLTWIKSYPTKKLNQLIKHPDFSRNPDVTRFLCLSLKEEMILCTGGNDTLILDMRI